MRALRRCWKSSVIRELNVLRNLAGIVLMLGIPAWCRAQSPKARFEVASVKLSAPETFGTRFGDPNAATFTATGVRLWGLIDIAYRVSDLQVVGLPKWEETTRYDVVAKPEGDKALSKEQLSEAMQQLLKDRFHLTVHHETRTFDGYKLVAGKSPAKLLPGQGDANSRIYLSNQGIDAANTSLSNLCDALRYKIGYPVEDDTGIRGSFRLNLRFTAGEEGASPLPSIFTAVQEQLGLKLVRAKVPLDIIVIDHVDREPTEN